MTAAKKSKKAVAKKAPEKKKAPVQKPAKKVAKQAKVDIAARLRSVPLAKAVEPPSYPVAIASTEAGKLYLLGKSARKQLATISGFELRFLDELPEYRSTLEKAEAAWNKARANGNEGAGPKTIEQAENLKSDLMASGRYLLRHDAVVQQRLDQIAEGTGLLDLAEDLRELALLWEEFQAVFSVDASLPRAAAARARDLADKLVANFIRPTSSDALANRNTAFWLVAQANSELRAALRFLFRKNPKKLNDLGVAYSAQNSRNRKLEGEKPPEPKPA